MKLEELRATANQVAAQHGRLEDAAQAKREAATDLLTAIIEAVRPALPAITSRVSWSEESVICVCPPGKFGAVYLTARGYFAVHEDDTGPPQLDPVEVASTLAAAIDAQLMGKKAKRTAQIEALAERMRAVAVLLRREP